MLIGFDGSVPSRRRKFLREALRFFFEQQLPQNVCEELEIDIEYVDLKDGLQADLACEESGRCPRFFTMRIDRKTARSTKKLLVCLAHESVHVKQYALNQLRTTLSRDPQPILKKYWKGRLWKPDKNETTAHDAPWEKEAYLKETELLMAWQNKSVDI